MLIGDLKLIGKNLRCARKELGLTQLDVAKHAGLSDRAYADIERGNANMRIETFIQICNALHATPNDILVKDDTAAAYDPAKLTDMINMCKPEEQDAICQMLTIYLNHKK